jgi:hypothetical protein
MEQYWDFFDETHTRLVRIQGQEMSLSWNGGETMEHSLTFPTMEAASCFAQMMLDLFEYKQIRKN